MVNSFCVYLEKGGVSGLQRGMRMLSQQHGDRGSIQGDHPKEDSAESERMCYSRCLGNWLNVE